ncbi:MAG: type IV pilin-like G/H family protein [Geitlerinemataceae cyanobacterium]
MNIPPESKVMKKATDDRCLTPTGFLLRLAIYSSVVSAIVLPSFLSYRSFKFNLFDGAAKAKPAEGRSSVGAAIRAQKAYYLENGKFTDSIGELRLGLQPETNNYRYQIWIAPERGPFQILNRTLFSQGVIFTATAKSPNLKSYTGIVGIDPLNSQAKTTISRVCETLEPSQVSPLFPTLSQSDRDSATIVSCPKGSTPLY